MPAHDLDRYARFRRWPRAEQPEGERARADLSADLAGAGVWVVHLSGRNWDGPFDRPVYLCLTEAEARMVVGEVAGPKPEAGHVAVGAYINVRVETVALQQVLQDEVLGAMLQRRLQSLCTHAPEAYDSASQHFLCLHRGTIVVLLLERGQLIEPARPDDDWPTELRWGKPLVVWNEAGLAGVMGPGGQLLVPCKFAALHSGLSDNRLLALREPLPIIREPIAPNAFTGFRCDVIDSQTGRRINPAGTSALLGSLGHDGECVAVMDDDERPGPVRMGFMNADGQWMGACRWANVLRFHEGLAAVQDADTLRWGYLDKAGRVVIAPQFLWPGYFNRQHAIVRAPLPSTPQPQPAMDDGTESAAWYLIGIDGQRLSGPWGFIDYAPHCHLLAQALEDAGSNRWSLLDDDGTPLLLNEPVSASEIADRGEPAPHETAARHLNRLWQERRRALALSVRSLPPHERVARYRPTTQRDLVSLGLWGQRVWCPKGVHSVALGAGAGAAHEGTIEYHYPVSLSTFDLAAEAPVTFTRGDGSTVCIGVPWGDLELSNRFTPSE